MDELSPIKKDVISHNDGSPEVQSGFEVPNEPIIPHQGYYSLLHSGLNIAKRSVQAGIVTAEFLPANEAIRYGALAYAIAASDSESLVGNAIMGGTVLGGTTLLVEGAGALAAAGLMDSHTGKRVMSWVNNKTRSLVPEDAKMSPLAEAGVAMVGGTAVLLAEKQRRDPNRTLQENRKHGLFTAGWMSAVFTIEGASIAAGFGSPTDPKAIGFFALTTAATIAGAKYSKNRLTGDGIYGKIDDLTQAELLQISDEDLRVSVEKANEFRAANDEAVKVGLYGEDVENALKDPGATLISYKSKNHEDVVAPLLVPIESLEWFNEDMLREKYGQSTELLYYAHPPVSISRKEKKAITEMMKEKLDNGAVIFTDEYQSHIEHGRDLWQSYFSTKDEERYSHEILGDGDKDRKIDVFAGEVHVGPERFVAKSQTLEDSYNDLVTRGELEEDKLNGVSLVPVITGDEAERIWEVYEKPFADLTEGHPSPAGFDKESLLAILADPNVSKFVNKVEGKISTLCFFVQDFDQCSWFNPKYYQDNYPQYFETDNIFMFPGIVSDENMRGHNYSLKVIDTMTKALANRATDFLVTFECTEISTQYIPKIVEAAVAGTGRAEIVGIDQPVSQMRYVGISK